MTEAESLLMDAIKTHQESNWAVVRVYSAKNEGVEHKREVIHTQRDVFEKSAMRGTTLSPLRHGVPWLQAAMADADDTADYLHPG